MTNTSMYGSLCARYYDLDKPIIDSDELSFYLHFLKSVKGPLLEPMCGSGRLMVPLLHAGFTVDGFDTSAAMLNLLLAKVQQRQLACKFWQGSITDLEYTNRYAAVLIPAGSINLIADIHELRASLERLHQALLPGGVLVFELITLHAMVQGPPDQWSTNAHTDTDGSLIVMSTTYEQPHNDMQQFISRYELVRDGGVVATETEAISLRFYDPAAMVCVLQELGLTDIQVRKAYSAYEEPGNSDETVMIVCSK